MSAAHEAFTALDLQAWRAGDPVRAEHFERVHRAALVRYCQGYVRDRDQAEDAAAEVVLKLLSSPEEPEALRPWMFRIARNLCLNRLRDAGPSANVALTAGVDWATSATGPITHAARADERVALERALNRLTPHERELLRLRYDDGLTREEIAQVLDLPPSVVKSRLYEALCRLREHYETSPAKR